MHVGHDGRSWCANSDVAGIWIPQVLDAMDCVAACCAPFRDLSHGRRRPHEVRAARDHQHRTTDAFHRDFGLRDHRVIE